MRKGLLPSAVLIGLTSVTFTVSAYALPQIKNFYPACKYTVIDTITARKNIRYVNGQVEKEQIPGKIDLLIQELREAAASQDADSLVIIDKNFNKRNSDRAYLELTAELLNDCGTGNDERGEAAPYNSAAQLFVSHGETKSRSYKIELTLTQPDTPDKPELNNDMTVGADAGLYGLPLGSSLEHTLSVFGTPTFEFLASDNKKVLAYGREHWLTFADDALVKVDYRTDLFAPTFTNNLAFDDRFDDRNWAISGKLKKGDTVTTEQLQEAEAKVPDAVLRVKTKEFLVRNQQAKERQVIGFELFAPGHQQTDVAGTINQRSDVTSSIADRLKSGQSSSSLSIDNIAGNVRGKSKEAGHATLYLLDAFTVVETTGATISKVHANPDFMRNIDVPERAWEFGEFFYGQTEEDALKAAGDLAFFLNGELEIDGGNYIVRLYMEEFAGESRVYSMELSLY